MTGGVDHLVWAVPVLEDGVALMERLTGVGAGPGGRHPRFGTHNALLSLGEDTYLEIIAPDPDAPPRSGGLVFGMDGIREPRLATWALRREDLEVSAEAAARAGCPLGELQSGFRDRTDGVRLTWRLTDPFAMPMGGVVPFLIAWGDTPHPASSAPVAGALMEVSVEHPDADGVRRVLEALGVEARVDRAPAPRLRARLSTARGIVEL